MDEPRMYFLFYDTIQHNNVDVRCAPSKDEAIKRWDETARRRDHRRNPRWSLRLLDLAAGDHIATVECTCRSVTAPTHEETCPVPLTIDRYVKELREAEDRLSAGLYVVLIDELVAGRLVDRVVGPFPWPEADIVCRMFDKAVGWTATIKSLATKTDVRELVAKIMNEHGQ